MHLKGMVFYMKVITNSPEETIKFAESIGQKLKGGDVIAYIGGLGVGKTTFTRGLSIGVGIGDIVTSPTFALVNEYKSDKCDKTLYHFDMYRILDSLDLETTGFYDYMSNNNILAIEWSENISDVLPDNTVYIKITRLDENKREIEIIGDERFA